MAVSTEIPKAHPPLQTKKQAAAFYAVSERTIDRWLCEGILPKKARVVVGGSVRFRPEVLMEHTRGMPPVQSEVAQ